MKIRIDMQGVQTESRHRGIGRYCLSITDAFLRLASPSHEVDLLFNAALDGIDEAIEVLADAKGGPRRYALGPVRHTAWHNRHNTARRNAAERVLSHALEAGEPDVVWLGSVVEGFSDDALAPHWIPRAFTVATLYDLIPLHDPHYLGESSARDWYMSRIDTLKRCDLLLAISEWVRADAIERLGIAPDRIVSIGAGVSPAFGPCLPGQDHTTYLRDRFRLDRPFVMYTGGFDRRKNVEALIEAYAKLPEAMRESHALVIVGRIAPIDLDRLTEIAVACGLRPDEVVFTGFVDDDDLVRLYQACALFVFPSQREGFGLTPLEAMACGAAVLVNDATSLPEVVGTADALIDASDPERMASRIHAALSDGRLIERLKEHGLARARHFTWDAVAARALAAIEETAGSRTDAGIVRDRPVAESLPVYRVTAENVQDTLPRLRRWPGTVIWNGPFPASGPTSASDRFRLGGYAALGASSTPEQWMTLLEQDAVGVLHSREAPPTELDACLARLRSEHPMGRQRAVEDAITASVGGALADDDLARVAYALDRCRRGATSRWLVDVTHVAVKDLGTGIHRVVRSILREWLRHPPEGVRIEPVMFHEGRYHHAHAYACELVGSGDASSLPGDIVAVSGDETFVGLDWNAESMPASAPILRMWKRAGVGMHFVVHDLLPITLPDCFHPQSQVIFREWLEAAASLGDAWHCVSRSTADALSLWLDTHGRRKGMRIACFPLGVEFAVDTKPAVLEAGLAKALTTRPSFLMVGTLEPRKGHAQVLDAFELAWASGVEINLVVVGHRGWLVNDLIERLQHHPERDIRLFWLDDADDATLQALYSDVTALIAASRGEGYGLPVIEAAYRGKPVIARSLPVFREIAGNYPFYFTDDSAAALATRLVQWLADRPPAGAHPPWPTWPQSARILADSVGEVTANQVILPAP